MQSGNSIRSLERGLTTLRTLSRLGPLTISEAAQHTQLPRQTVSRILFFLTELGYTSRRDSDKRFEVAETALHLTDSLHQASWLRGTVVPIMEKLCRHVLWPVSITQPRRLEMEILWETDAISPLVMHPAPVGLRFPLVTSIDGRVFLAFCDTEQRETLLQALLAERPEALNDIDLSQDMLEKQLQAIKAQGFYCDSMPHKGHGSLAAPVFDQNGLRGVLDIRFPSRALSLKDAVAKFADPVMQSAAEISGAFS
ncbi:MAG: IclR family transcriptional regulator C-terminal domain-containing protein [Rhodospirillaceae bacterium]